jgi:hypothetical protein
MGFKGPECSFRRAPGVRRIAPLQPDLVIFYEAIRAHHLLDN